jgi:hypothetical protein
VSIFRRASRPLSIPPAQILESLRPGGTAPGDVGHGQLPAIATQADADSVLQLALAEVERVTADTATLLQASIDRLVSESRDARASARAQSEPPPVRPLPSKPDP